LGRYRRRRSRPTTQLTFSNRTATGTDSLKPFSHDITDVKEKLKQITALELAGALLGPRLLDPGPCLKRDGCPGAGLVNKIFRAFRKVNRKLRPLKNLGKDYVDWFRNVFSSKSPVNPEPEPVTLTDEERAMMEKLQQREAQHLSSQSPEPAPGEEAMSEYFRAESYEYGANGQPVLQQTVMEQFGRKEARREIIKGTDLAKELGNLADAQRMFDMGFEAFWPIEAWQNDGKVPLAREPSRLTWKHPNDMHHISNKALKTGLWKDVNLKSEQAKRQFKQMIREGQPVRDSLGQPIMASEGPETEGLQFIKLQRVTEHHTPERELRPAMRILDQDGKPLRSKDKELRMRWKMHEDGELDVDMWEAKGLGEPKSIYKPPNQGNPTVTTAMTAPPETATPTPTQTPTSMPTPAFNPSSTTSSTPTPTPVASSPSSTATSPTPTSDLSLPVTTTSSSSSTSDSATPTTLETSAKPQPTETPLGLMPYICGHAWKLEHPGSEHPECCAAWFSGNGKTDGLDMSECKASEPAPTDPNSSSSSSSEDPSGSDQLAGGMLETGCGLED
jgi:hypothetical protein